MIYEHENCTSVSSYSVSQYGYYLYLPLSNLCVITTKIIYDKP